MGWFAGIAGFIGLKEYDNYEIKSIRESFAADCEAIRSQPLGVLDFPRKVLIYIPKTKYSRESFNDFIKPLLDNAALDYELHAVDFEEISQLAKKRLETAIQFYQEKEKPLPRTWFGWGAPIQPRKHEFPLFNLPAYDSTRGAVAIGPMAWRFLLQGISLVPSQDIQVYHPLGYVHSQDLTGWKWVPWRMGLWFFQRFEAKRAAQDIMAVIKEKTRSFVPGQDEWLGSDAFIPVKDEENPLSDVQYGKTLDPELASRLSVYTL